MSLTPLGSPPDDVAETSEAAERLKETVRGIAGRLDRLAQDQVAKKQMIEDRWLGDLRQYHGMYDEATLEELVDDKKSQHFVGLTRSKTNAWEARLSDMLFPTDDKNWGVRSTPVPELTKRAREHKMKAMAITDDANFELSQGNKEAAQGIAQTAVPHVEKGKQLSDMAEESRKRAIAMEQEIEDQLIESNYAARCRDVIHDGCKLGTGVVKGPTNKLKRGIRWEGVSDGQNTVYELTGEQTTPVLTRVDPWSYFPDMSARTADEKEFDFERYLFTASQLRTKAKEWGFDPKAVRSLLKEGSRESVPDYISKIRSMTGINENMENRFVVWEYQGPLDASEVEALQTAHMRDDETYEPITVDPLAENRYIIFFCQGSILKFGPHPLDSGESMYSVFNFERDDTSIFGFGVPYLMRDSQSAVNAAWRMMVDNGGLAAGPQIVIDKDRVVPEDGDYTLTPRKVWLKGAATQPNERLFETYDVPCNQQYLANLISLAKQFADEETNMPVYAQGEAGARSNAPEGAKTMGGLAMLMNSVNVVFRRVVRNWDDDVTAPLIRRFYHWNMQFNSRDDIKGDMEVDARGSSVLLVRELQAQNLMSIVLNWSTHPELSPILKLTDAARKAVQASMISHEDIIKSDEEIQVWAEQQANEEQPEDPKITIAKMQIEAENQRAQFARETELIKLAGQRDMTVEKLKAQLQIAREGHQSTERKLVSEAALEQRAANEARARGEKPKGSGGYLSAA